MSVLSRKFRPVFFRSAAVASLFVLWAALTFSSALAEISIAVALIAWIAWKLALDRRMPSEIHWPLAGFVLLVALSIFWSEFPKQSFRGMLRSLKQIAVFLMVADLFQSGRILARFEKIFLGVALMILADGFIQYAWGRDFLRGFEAMPFNGSVRLTASFGTYGRFAAYLLLTTPYLMGIAYDSLRRKKIRTAVIVALMGLGSLVLLFLTKSRGAGLAFLAGLIVILFLSRKWILLWILLFAVAAAVFLLPRGVILHLDAQQKEQSLVERYYLWERALDVIRAKPLTGTGINTYAVAHQKYDRTKNWRVKNYYAHNGYLQMAAETGLPSLFLFLTFLGNYFLRHFRALSKGRAEDSPARTGLLIGLINFLLFALADTVLHNPLPVLSFWFVLGLQSAYSRSKKAVEPGF